MRLASVVAFLCIMGCGRRSISPSVVTPLQVGAPTFLAVYVGNRTQWPLVVPDPYSSNAYVVPVGGQVEIDVWNLPAAISVTGYTYALPTRYYTGTATLGVQYQWWSSEVSIALGP